jgi:uncharacterized protein YxeA
MKTILVVILLVIHTALAMVAGFYTGVHETHREAYKNGLMTIQRDGDKRHYRWIETHKLGYDYDQ